MTICSLDGLLSQFWNCSMSGSNCCFLTCIQISQEAGKVVWYSHLLKNFAQFAVIHTVKGFNIVNEAEVDAFLEFSCFFYDPVDVGNLISGSSAFSKSSLYIWKFTVHILLKPSLEDFEHDLANIWNECNCAVVWTFFGTALLLGLEWKLIFSICGLMNFPNLLVHWGQFSHSVMSDSLKVTQINSIIMLTKKMYSLRVAS